MTYPSFAVHSAELTSRKTWISALCVIVVVNVSVLDHSWEFNVVQLFASQQFHILECCHSFNQLSRFLKLILVD